MLSGNLSINITDLFKLNGQKMYKFKMIRSIPKQPEEGISKLHSDPNLRFFRWIRFFAKCLWPIGYVTLRKIEPTKKALNLAREASFEIPSEESFFGGVGFASKFQTFTRALPPAMIAGSEPKILRSLLAKKRFFRLFRYIFLLTLSANLFAEPLDYGIEEIKDTSNLPILNPDLSERKTAKIRLINGLEVLLISDPGADQSAATISVEVGSWDDPKQYPGMAHFCEHMLFMGSHTYPGENEFSKMLADYNGTPNAFTAPDRTVYMFACKTEGFLAILDRFAHFFIDPLFNPSGVSRELEIVDQEYAKNLENDGWREYMVFKELGNPLHPNRGFSTGNSQTLKGIPQESLKSWHRKHYGANRMHLVIYSPLSLDELTSAVSSSFSSVPTVRPQTRLEEDFITSDAQRGHITYIKPIKNRNILSLMWELPSEFSDDPAKSAPLLAYALNQGQKFNLYEKLKAEQLIDSLFVSVETQGGKDHRFFQICLELTEKGIKELSTSVLRCFEALATHRSLGIPSYLFEEKNEQTKLLYQYQSRQDAFHFAMKIGDELVDESLETYPRARLLAEVYNPEKIEKLIDTLSPESCIFSLLAPPELTEVPPTQKEKWFGAEYTVKEVPSDWLALWKNAQPNPAIRIAPPNPFVVSELSLVSDSASPIPELMAENSFGTAYYCRVPEFRTPEVGVHLHIRSAALKPDARSACLSSLYLDHLTDILHPLLASAASSGLSTQFDFDSAILSLSVSGFSEKAPLLLQEIMKQMPKDPPTLEQFNVYVARHRKDYLNSQKELAFRQGKELIDSLLVYGKSTKIQKLRELDAISYEEFLDFHKKLFEKTYVEAFFGGNLSLKQAQSCWLDVQHFLVRAPYPKEEHSTKKVLTLSDQASPLLVSKTVDVLGNATLLLLDQGLFTFESRAAQEILSNALYEAFFDTLRTKQKTGYIASSQAFALEARLFQLFLVQSNSHQPDDLLYRFELFLETFHEEIKTNISSDRFETIRESMIHSLQTRFRNLEEKVALWDMLAFQEKGNFRFIEERLQALNELSYERFIELARQSLDRKNRKRLAVLCEGKLADPFIYELIAPEEIPSLAGYSARSD